MASAPLLHVTRPEAWFAARDGGSFEGDTLATDGSIPCATAAQVVGVVNRLYGGGNGEWVLVIDPDAVRPEIVWEESEPAQAPFPHIHGPLNTDAVIDAFRWDLMADRGDTIVLRLPGGSVAKIGSESSAAALAHDAHCLEFVSTRGGGDYATGFVSSRVGMVVMDEVTGATPLSDLLLGHDILAAERGVIAWAEAIARMHASTGGPEAEAAFGQAANTWSAPPDDLLRRMADLAQGFGVDPGDVAGLTIPAPSLTAMTHGDPCPDNVFITPDGARLIDFVWGGYRTPARDLVYLEVPFPSCWCAGTIPSALAARAENAYLAITGYEPDVWAREKDIAVALWVAVMLNSSFVPDLTRDDHRWGISSGRPRVLRWLESGARIVGAELAPFAALCGRLLDHLAARWPDVEPLGTYPAFRPPGPPIRN